MLAIRNSFKATRSSFRFPKITFDIVTVGYGLRNLTSWESGLDEMRRVAKPGARLIVLDFGKPANALWRGIYFAHLKCSVPLHGLVVLRQRVRPTPTFSNR